MPAGQTEIICFDCVDLGMERDPFAPDPEPGEEPKMRHRIELKYESMSHMMDDGRPYTINLRVNMSGHPRSTLRQTRNKMAGRDITEQEAYNFDDAEVIGVRCGALIEHREGGNGQTYSNVSAIWRLPEDRQTDGKVHNGRAGSEGNTPLQNPATAQQKTPHPLDHPRPPLPTKASDDLPF